ncbi:MAG TPA: NAD(P)H-dependent glycerol-3-phosphate dehydrogenase [Acidimicrobiia bacterium]|nr:NAD(P)H-dependent glycerol-3-phosphate dehydrogenase [Acidimicrobiia bacterium]
MTRIAVIGAGSWGTTAAALAARAAPTVLWSRRQDVADHINREHRNPIYMPGQPLPDSLLATSDLGEAVEGATAVVMAVPSHGFRDVYTQAAPAIDSRVPILSLTKGIEQGSLATMTQVIAEVSPEHDPDRIGVLTGPNLAAEVAAGQPTAAVVAFADQEAAMVLQSIFMGPSFRVYTHDDVPGCELGGALKNVMAIAAGMSDGLGFGDNTRATLITRALAELSRLGIALGGRPSTFAGLAGMGDLIATCISTTSRNHRVGFGLARGQTLQEITTEMKMVAEGIKTTRAVLDLASRHGIEMPIATHVGLVLYEEMDPREAVMRLMSREAKPED